MVGGAASGPLLVAALVMLLALAWRRGGLGSGDVSWSSGDGASATGHHGGGFHGGGGHGGGGHGG